VRKIIGYLARKGASEKNFEGIVNQGASSYYTVQIINVDEPSKGVSSKMSSKGVSSNVVGHSGLHDGDYGRVLCVRTE